MKVKQKLRLVFAPTLVFAIGLLTACQHFNPADTVRQEKPINIAVINSDTYMLVPGAHCIISTDTGEESIETKLNPDMILLEANYHSLSLECAAPNYKQHAIAITNVIGHWSAADLFMLPGNVVDTTSSLLPYYPSHVLVLMNHQPFTSKETTEKILKHTNAADPLFQGTLR